MTTSTAGRPTADEYSPYYGGYVSLVPEGDILYTLERRRDALLELLRGIPETKASSRYAPGKWSVKEVVGHVIDTERIFAYRALRFARGDRTPLPGFEQEGYVSNASFDTRTLSDLADEFDLVRRANLHLFRNLDAEAWSRSGEASGARVTVRALAYIIAGHELHHTNILATRYLSA